MVRSKIMRIVDANLNRSREGLRVCEDIARFVLDSRNLTAELKSIRHLVSDSAKRFIVDSSMISSSRDSGRDISRCSHIASEMHRRGIKDIFCANIERVKESIRVLEEFFKIIDPKSSIRYSELRFRVYEIERAAVKKIEAIEE